MSQILTATKQQYLNFSGNSERFLLSGHYQVTQLLFINLESERLCMLMFKLFSFNEQDLKNVQKLQESKVSSRKVVGRGTLVADASEIRNTKTFQENAERASRLVAAD